MPLICPTKLDIAGRCLEGPIDILFLWKGTSKEAFELLLLQGSYSLLLNDLWIFEPRPDKDRRYPANLMFCLSFFRLDKFRRPLMALSCSWLRTLHRFFIAVLASQFKARLAKGQTLDDILVEAFAVVREATFRILGLRPYDVQLVGGMILHEGQVAEMRTGEGKTLVSLLPAYLNALEGKGVHVVTVNDYLARRDMELNSQVLVDDFVSDVER